ncbi:hypothetical protein [Xanthomonas oryzae]|nr:hypothetical protein [Xanthomonas oryzae]QQD50264.1 hypothetical protein BXO512_003985 [Xanthomonas oryzae pv. oryzae]UXV87404.1 hypothetical protein IXO134_017410 [Xanthomonas oryzae pv. oryzae]UXV95123.1 hypothetical protein IXO74_019270 [Xanthomonas oryzae pv. oryzae]UXW08103.1 hypothetical protein IXO220_017270 [Xanthomonas oryzae pv. oryzae]UXW11804.1 hypothetical protein IXO221_016930 [Xanthomonas oryzae pv. oryzae]
MATCPYSLEENWQRSLAMQAALLTLHKSRIGATYAAHNGDTCCRRFAAAVPSGY